MPLLGDQAWTLISGYDVLFGKPGGAGGGGCDRGGRGAASGAGRAPPGAGEGRRRGRGPGDWGAGPVLSGGRARPSQGVGQRLFGALDHTGVELGVAPGVLGEVVAPHEALLAQRAAELLLARVRPVVARQLVRARELFKAVWPRAGEGPLTCEKGGKTGRGDAAAQPRGARSASLPLPRPTPTPTPREARGWGTPPGVSTRPARTSDSHRLRGCH